MENEDFSPVDDPFYMSPMTQWEELSKLYYEWAFFFFLSKTSSQSKDRTALSTNYM